MMMNKKEIFKKVGGIISELNEQFEYLSQNPDNLNELELELFAANADFLSDHISILLKLNKSSGELKKDNTISEIKNEETRNVVSVKSESHEEEVYEEEVEEVTIPDWKFGIENESLVSFDFEEKSADELFDRPLTEEEMRVIDEKTRLKTVPLEESVVDLDKSEAMENLQHVISEEPIVEFQANETIEEPVSHSESDLHPLTLNEILSAQSSQNTVSSQFNQRQSKDLKGLISLNDKLQFVRDLFNGYSLAYSEAIELLNRFDNFEAADNFLKQNYALKNSWAEKQDVADKFYEILNRRFSK
ncbi:hypothetical protein SAMN05421813_11266 [Daejeonella rubra]|uniref:Uncharacterized protein n=1 Tax=Daejeonella rubra TaxID=990371 RepID=A0A1G9T9N8_9SPHI|nr:hypothetical protein [Daejeonella rubra]SDM44356.1 hypothetical protein SAMN05421813_11266 [Daejeonella rubra]